MYSQPKHIRTGLHSDGGFSLVELMIAIAIFSIGVMAVASLQVSAIAGNGGARKIADELVVAETLLEELMAQQYTHADLDPAGNSHQRTPVGPDNAYTADWQVVLLDLSGDGVDDAKQIQLTVTNAGVGNRTATLQHIIPDPNA
jgi:type IV pilus assembly protein PilV